MMSDNASHVTACVIRTDEELGIARTMERVPANVKKRGI